MALSTIDGMVEEMVLKRSKRGLDQYERIVFALADGSRKTWAGAVVEQSIVALVKPGARGRFYLYTTMDHRGVYGVRTADGASAFHFSAQYEKFALVLALVNLAVVLISAAVLDKLQLISLILLLLFTPIYVYYRSLRAQARSRFDADGGFRPSAAAPAMGAS